MSTDTTVRDIQFFRARSTRTAAIADATHEISEISFIVTRLRLSNGVTNESYLLSFHYSPEAIAGALRDVHPLAMSADACRTGEFLTRL
jgi:hypothetical protein